MPSASAGRSSCRRRLSSWPICPVDFLRSCRLASSFVLEVVVEIVRDRGEPVRPQCESGPCRQLWLERGPDRERSKYPHVQEPDALSLHRISFRLRPCIGESPAGFSLTRSTCFVRTLRHRGFAAAEDLCDAGMNSSIDAPYSPISFTISSSA